MDAKDCIDAQAAIERLERFQNHSNQQRSRRFKRFAVRSQAMLASGAVDSANKNAVIVQVRDISRGGAGIMSSSPGLIGQFWQLHIIQDSVTVATLPAFCRYCHQISDGMYLIGAEFGAQASILLALGITPKELAAGDEPESARPLAGEFVKPESLLHSEHT